MKKIIGIILVVVLFCLYASIITYFLGWIALLIILCAIVISSIIWFIIWLLTSD